MATINPHVNFPGTAEEAFRFYESAFGTKISSLMRWREAPGGDKLPPDAQNKVMHAAIRIGDTALMGADAIEGMGPAWRPGNDFHVNVNAKDRAEADRIFGKLSEG
jgi:PhnB protein